MPRLLALFLAVYASSALAAGAQDAPKEGSDPAQGFQSPFQVGSGATLSITQDKKTLTAALTGQLQRAAPVNVWQLAFTGTTSDEGKGLAFSSSDKDAPGFKAKVGLGYSSFQATETATYTAQAARFLLEAWCLDVLKEINKTLPNPATRTSGAGCQAFFTLVDQSFMAAPPADEEPAKTAKAALETLRQIVAALTPQKRLGACEMFRNTAKVVYKYCVDSGAPQKSAEDQRVAYPDIYPLFVISQLPSFYYVLYGNYQPTIASTSYRDVVNGVIDLATKHQWTQLLHGASFDTALYYRRLAAGVQIAYVQTVDIEQTSVCKVTTSGDYRAEQCKDAMLGKPDPKKAYSFTGALALDPLILPSATTIARPGAQLEFRYERPTTGSGYKTDLSVPVFLAPVQSPLKLVIGVRPAWTRDTTGDDPDRHFSVFFFIGARPRVGS